MPILGEVSHSRGSLNYPATLLCHTGSKPGSGKNRVFDKPHVKKTGSEGIAGPDVLKLLGHLRWGSVQLFRDVLLFVGLHGVELLTQVSINHILGHGKMRAKEKGQVPKENDTHKAAAARKALYSPTKTFTPRAEPGTLP